MKRDFYSASVADFRNTVPDQILGQLTANNPFTLEQTQRDAWLEEIDILQNILSNREGFIYFEYAIPRMGKRIDVVLIIGPVILFWNSRSAKRSSLPQDWIRFATTLWISRIFMSPATHV